MFWLSKLFSSLRHPGWQYRFRYSNTQGKWVIELSTNYDWIALQSVRDNRVQIEEFSTFAEARAYSYKVGLDKVYKLNNEIVDTHSYFSVQTLNGGPFSTVSPATGLALSEGTFPSDVANSTFQPSSSTLERADMRNATNHSQ